MSETTKKWKYGVHRWFVLAFVIAGVVAAGAYPPISPHIQLPAENVINTGQSFFGKPFYITNTIIAMLVADVILLLIAFSVRRATRDPNALPKGISGAVEALLEGLYNLTAGTAGKWARTIFPFFATITLMVLVWNWMGLIPGVDSIGLIEPVHAEGVHGFQVEEVFAGVSTIVEAQEGAHPTESYLLVPFVRPASTDLNFTLALAIIAVVAIQWIGLKAQGLSYLTKFFNFKTVFSVPIFGIIDLLVGLLELVGEIAKVLSFSFRLFGNIFAGAVLLFVIGSLAPVAQTGFLMLEFFVGLIQAIVFGMLTMVFMSQATESHGDGEEH